MAKTAPLAEISLKYVDSDMYLERLRQIYLNFAALRLCEISEALGSRAVKVVFHFLGFAR